MNSRRINSNRALKVRNINAVISLFQSFTIIALSYPGATRLTLFGACPWLSHFAPSALNYVWRLPLAFTFRAFGAELSSALAPWLSYFAPLALNYVRRPPGVRLALVL
jgi:hypothetical protein